MPILLQNKITTNDLVNNDFCVYIYGDNLKRVGMGGLAKICRPYSNTVGVAVKNYPAMDEGAFFSDQNFELHKGQIDEDMEKVAKHLREGRVVVFPTGGIGSGLAQLPERAPQLYAYLSEKVARLIKLYNKKGAVL